MHIYLEIVYLFLSLSFGSWVYRIDKIRLRHAMPSLLEVVNNEPTLTTLGAALSSVNFEQGINLSILPFFTLFAPTNEAFSAVLPVSENAESQYARIVQLLTLHMVPERLFAADLLMHTVIETLQGSRVRITVHDALYVGESKVIKPNIVCDGGVVHIVDALLTPIEIL